MSGMVSSWIAKAVVKYDKEHGSNLKAGVSGIKRLVQIKKFHTYRGPEDPEAQIIALISDKTHHVVAEFDVKATNRFESEDTDLPPERLTSKLRHIIMIKSYRWKVETPRDRAPQGLEMPVLKMEILDFDDYSGSPDEPNYFEDVVDVGWGRDDGSAQQVLRKWYYGESHSDMSEVEKSFERSQPSQPQAGPSRLPVGSPVQAQKSSTLPDGVITLADFLEPYLSEGGDRKGKAIPDWLFETSEEDQAALEQITMFGLELNTTTNEEERTTTEPAGAISSPVAQQTTRQSPPVCPSPDSPRIIKGRARAESSSQVEAEAMAPPKSSINTTYLPTQTPPVPLGQRMRSTQTATQAITLPESSGNPADDESSESEVEMQIKPLRQVRQPRRSRVMFDPLAFPEPRLVPDTRADEPKLTSTKERQARQEDVERHEDDSGQDTDSDMLSDYEKQARQRKRPRAASFQDQDQSSLDQETTETVPPPNGQLEEDESIPASESVESYSLTNQYPSPSKKRVITEDVTEGSTTMRIEASTVVDHVAPPTAGSLDKSQGQGSFQTNTNTNSSARTDGTDSLPTPPPSDHEPEAQIPSLESESVQPIGNAADVPALQPKSEKTTPRTSLSQRARMGTAGPGSRGSLPPSQAVAAKTEPTSSRKTTLLDVGDSSEASSSRQLLDTPPEAGRSRQRLEVAKEEPLSSKRSIDPNHGRSTEASSSRLINSQTPSGASRKAAKQEPTSLRQTINPNSNRPNEASSSRTTASDTPSAASRKLPKEEPASSRRAIVPSYGRATEAGSSRHTLALAETPSGGGISAKQEPTSLRRPVIPTQDRSNEATSSRDSLDTPPVAKKARYTLDLTVPGLSNAKIQEYIDRVRAARSAPSTTKREK